MDSFTHIRTIPLGSPLISYCDGNRLFVGDYTNGLNVFPLSKPSDYIVNLDYLKVTGIVGYNGDIIVSDFDVNGELMVLNHRLEDVGKIVIGGSAVIRGMSIYDGVLYCAVGGILVAGVRSFNLVNREIIQHTAPTCFDVAVNSEYIVVAVPSYADSIRVYDHSMNLLMSESQNGKCYGVCLDGDVIYAACKTEIDVYSANDLSLLETISEIDGNALVDVQKVMVRDGCLFVCDYSVGDMYIIRAYYRNEDTTTGIMSGIIDGENPVIINDNPLLVDDATVESSPGMITVPETKFSYAMEQL
jgi:hypothetical protein